MLKPQTPLTPRHIRILRTSGGLGRTGSAGTVGGDKSMFFVIVLPASLPWDTLRYRIARRESPRSRTRQCKQHKVQTSSDRKLHNTLRPVWCSVYSGGGVWLHETLYRYELKSLYRVTTPVVSFYTYKFLIYTNRYMTYGYGTCHIPYLVRICAMSGIPWLRV